ncbi:sensor histidine kinase [Bacillus sp. M6-12]|uniref:HAMP domain-containing sensor histidine kinase n=1 Tax=Bacillus sp. M6-12 TaxID=2054166 RepID=UPI000C76B0F7|nr:HAMP domain-containing sensor histidine kinase [Bacillus sp. M6-12]PLS17288.1 sensor histidine kinase [Bacillus sp. M6-12]
MKLKNSLLSKYLLIIFIAIILVPASMPVFSIIFYMPAIEGPNIYQNGTDLEEMWQNEAKKLTGASNEQINKRLMQIKQEYQKATVFWVDQSGKSMFKQPDDVRVPDSWNPAYTIDFMKKSRGLKADPFTVVALIGDEQDQGFMVFQVPRSEMKAPGETVAERYSYLMILGVLFILLFFIFISWIFFSKIRKRLLRLQEAMTETSANGIPPAIEVDKPDEIGRLVAAFNSMIIQLEESRSREKEEEELRRQLIANLSHDLRTPLTAIRGHAFALKNEIISKKGQHSLELIDNKIGYLDQLIDNLLSYTLLTSGKYPYNPVNTDIVRVLRTSFAGWYPVFEDQGFQIELNIPEHPLYWEVDLQWMERVLDNLFQNINRHARDGKYIAIMADVNKQAITIADKGPGMTGESEGKGAGVGLSIISLMLKEMKLNWSIESDEKGTRNIIYK